MPCWSRGSRDTNGWTHQTSMWPMSRRRTPGSSAAPGRASARHLGATDELLTLTSVVRAGYNDQHEHPGLPAKPKQGRMGSLFFLFHIRKFGKKDHIFLWQWLKFL